MSVYNLWDKDTREAKLKQSLSTEWKLKSPLVTSRSSSPPSRIGETIFNNYIDLVNSKSNISTNAKQTEHTERPFDFYDDEEFAFGINLLNSNVACVGDNITKLIQMAQEPWPDNVKLYQPYEVEQILLPDNASCLAVQAFLKMCNLPFEVEMRWNAEFMSPSGRVPFIKCGAFVVSELEPIVQFAANKGVTLCSRLSTEEKAEMRAYMSLITNVLVNAELYISWLDEETFNAVTRVRNSSVYPWPLGWLQTRSKRNAVAKRLKALHWYDKTLDQVLADVEQCCNSLSQRLGEKDYFFGATPTPLDALIYGHMRALLSATGPKAAAVIKPITSALLRLVLRVTNLIAMNLTPQEEYLITHAFQVSNSRRLSPIRTVSDRSTRSKRSRMSVRNPSKDTLAYNRDVFGFKPFASKKIVVMPSKEGGITCEYPHRYDDIDSNVNRIFAIEIIDDIIVKVDEIVTDGSNGKTDIGNEKHDFEVIALPNFENDSKYRVDVIESEFLDTIDENDLTDTIISMDAVDDVIHTMNDEDSDGLVTDKLLDVENEPELYFNTDVTDSSYNNRLRQSYATITSSGDQISTRNMPVLSEISRSPDSSGSQSTLVMPSNEEISVETFLKYLRKRNAAYTPEMAEID